MYINKEKKLNVSDIYQVEKEGKLSVSHVY
jgi:hypothetical protein